MKKKSMRYALLAMITTLSALILLTGCALTAKLPSSGTEEQRLSAAADTDSDAPDSKVTHTISESDTDLPADDAPKLPEAEDLYALRDLLCSAKERGETRVQFRYTGKDVFEASDIARMTSALYVSYTYVDDCYDLEMTEYPGDRMLRAYRTQERRALTAEESVLLDRAVSIVDSIKMAHADPYAVELAIYEYTVNAIDYCNPTVEISDKDNPPRHLSVLGALGDGMANCQGYADTFYLLGSIAGLEVSRMNVTDANGLWHILNTVRLGDFWYVVDTTYADSSPISYRFFNAARDMCSDYSWGEEMEYNRIADTSDAQFYYYSDSGRCFDSLESMAEHITEGYLRGERLFSLMLRGRIAIYSDLTEILSEKLTAAGRDCSYRVATEQASRNTFFTVIF